MNEFPFVPWSNYREYPDDEMFERPCGFHAEPKRRRTVRHFSSRPVPQAIIDDCLRAASTASSRANLQPSHFVVVRCAALLAAGGRLPRRERDSARHRAQAARRNRRRRVTPGTDQRRSHPGASSPAR